MRRVYTILFILAISGTLFTQGLRAQTAGGLLPAAIAAAYAPSLRGVSMNIHPPTDTENEGVAEANVTLPAEWTGLSAFHADEGLMLRWSTAQERGSAWFKIEARYADRDVWRVLDILPAAGESSTPRYYSWLHRSPPQGPIEYRLRQIDAFGEETSTGMVTVEAGNWSALTLTPCSPNPATTETLVSIANSDSAAGSLVIEDAEGKVRQIVFQYLELMPGAYRFRIDTSTLPAGSYRMRLCTDAGIHSRELVVVR